MLSVIFIWLYIGITTFIMGYGVLRVLTRHLPHYTPNADAYFMCGLVCVTVYAQFFQSVCGRGAVGECDIVRGLHFDYAGRQKGAYGCAAADDMFYGEPF